MPPKIAPPISDQQRVEATNQLKELQQEVRYDQRDFTVDYLVHSFRDGLFFIPEYQRLFIWPDKVKSQFIESILLGLPIPMLFVADMDSGNLEIVDGAQRIQTLEAFMSNDLVLSELSLLKSLNGFRYNDLPLSQQRKFQTKALRLIVLEDGTTEELRQELFHRINTQAVRARGSEIRRGSFKGPFVDFIKDSAQLPLFRQLCPMTPNLLKRREDEELITRFLCYSDRYEKFRHDVDKFLDNFVKDNKDVFDEGRMRQELTATLDFVKKYFPYGFSKGKTSASTPRVRFEAIAVGVNLALRKKPNLIPSRHVAEWLDSEEFGLLTTTHASNSGPRLRKRIEFVRDQLLAS